MGGVLLFGAVAFLFLMMLETRRDVREISEQINTLHKDFISEMAVKYGELYGKK